MSMPHKQPDQNRIVAFLAGDFDLPLEDVAKIYAEQRAELCLSARNTTFVDIFATRNVEEILRKRSLGQNAVRT